MEQDHYNASGYFLEIMSLFGQITSEKESNLLT